MILRHCMKVAGSGLTMRHLPGNAQPCLAAPASNSATSHDHASFAAPVCLKMYSPALQRLPPTLRRCMAEIVSNHMVMLSRFSLCTPTNGRCYKLNLRALSQHGTVEFRHPGWLVVPGSH